MDIFNTLFKFIAFIFEQIGNVAKYYMCFGYFDESEVPQELLDEDK